LKQRILSRTTLQFEDIYNIINIIFSIFSPTENTTRCWRSTMVICCLILQRVFTLFQCIMYQFVFLILFCVHLYVRRKREQTLSSELNKILLTLIGTVVVLELLLLVVTYTRPIIVGVLAYKKTKWIKRTKRYSSDAWDLNVCWNLR
jgi:hypothetical protein